MSCKWSKHLSAELPETSAAPKVRNQSLRPTGESTAGFFCFFVCTIFRLDVIELTCHSWLNHKGSSEKTNAKSTVAYYGWQTALLSSVVGRKMLFWFWRWESIRKQGYGFSASSLAFKLKLHNFPGTTIDFFLLHLQQPVAVTIMMMCYIL